MPDSRQKQELKSANNTLLCRTIGFFTPRRGKRTLYACHQKRILPVSGFEFPFQKPLLNGLILQQRLLASRFGIWISFEGRNSLFAFRFFRPTNGRRYSSDPRYAPEFYRFINCKPALPSKPDVPVSGIHNQSIRPLLLS